MVVEQAMVITVQEAEDPEVPCPPSAPRREVTFAPFPEMIPDLYLDLIPDSDDEVEEILPKNAHNRRVEATIRYGAPTLPSVLKAAAIGHTAPAEAVGVEKSASPVPADEVEMKVGSVSHAPSLAKEKVQAARADFDPPAPAVAAPAAVTPLPTVSALPVADSRSMEASTDLASKALPPLEAKDAHSAPQSGPTEAQETATAAVEEEIAGEHSGSASPFPRCGEGAGGVQRGGGRASGCDRRASDAPSSLPPPLTPAAPEPTVVERSTVAEEAAPAEREEAEEAKAVEESPRRGCRCSAVRGLRCAGRGGGADGGICRRSFDCISHCGGGGGAGRCRPSACSLLFLCRLRCPLCVAAALCSPRRGCRRHGLRLLRLRSRRLPAGLRWQRGSRRRRRRSGRRGDGGGHRRARVPRPLPGRGGREGGGEAARQPRRRRAPLHHRAHSSRVGRPPPHPSRPL